MKLTLCLVLGAVAATTTYADDCPFMCTEVYEPVCGSDGVTYSNECILSLADCDSQETITQVHAGECSTTETTSSSTDSSGSVACPDVCPMIYQPVCGSDGVTYSNNCMLGIAQCESGGAITQVSEGQCPGSSSSYESGSVSCPDVCIEIFRPVCGSDGVTYANSCFLDMASCNDPSITLAHEGACVTSGGSYETSNNSTNSSEETSVDSETSSQSSSSSCPDVCLAVYAPVCGSDGVTYGNECKLEVTSCNNPELHLTKVSDGACSSECKTAL